MLLSVVVFALFLILSAVHLHAQKEGLTRVHRLTKPFLIPLLYLSLLLMMNASGKPANYFLIIAAALFYTVGDILLLDKGFLRLLFGAVSFACGHAALSTFFLRESFSPAALAAGAVIAALPFGVYLKKVFAKRPEHLWRFIVYGLAVYLFFVSVSASLSISSPASSVLAVTGVVFFGISDSRIVYNLVKHLCTSVFSIMWTYVAANLLLCVAVLLR